MAENKSNAPDIILIAMDKLEKLYEAVDMLESLELPVSYEQRAAIAQIEKEYLRNEIIPLIKQELEPLIKNMRNRFSLSIKYSRIIATK